jgi:hypothetical protein
MEAFESFVALALETEGFAVSSGVKFRVKRPTAKAAYKEEQTHGYEVDLVAARSRSLVLATVKSFFGSGGVRAEHVTGDTGVDRLRKRYLILNDRTLRKRIVQQAAAQYGYTTSQVQVRLYVGRFAGPKQGLHEKKIRAWAAKQKLGGGPIKVHNAAEVIKFVRREAAQKQYRDNPVLVTMKVLEAAKQLAPDPDGELIE